MSRRRRWPLRIALTALAVLLVALFVPELSAMPDQPPEPNPFIWGQDALWERLEREFDAARERGCDTEAPAIDEGLAALDETIAAIEARPLAADAPPLRDAEERLFDLAPRFGACLDRVPELAERTGRLRAAVKRQSERWDVGSSRPARDRLYRLLYGSRAALEELLLAMDDAPGLLHGTDEPSETPSIEFHGVTLHSGDVLASRGGAPTSAFIARGNDYPGNFSHIALLHVSDDGGRATRHRSRTSRVGVGTVSSLEHVHGGQEAAR